MSAIDKETKSGNYQKRSKVKEKINRTHDGKSAGNFVTSKDKTSITVDEMSKVKENVNQSDDEKSAGNSNDETTDTEFKIGEVFSLPAESYLYQPSAKETPKSVEELLDGKGKTAYLSQVKCKPCSVEVTNIDSLLKGRTKVSYKTWTRRSETYSAKFKKRKCLLSSSGPSRKRKKVEGTCYDGKMPYYLPSTDPNLSASKYIVNTGGTPYTFHNVFKDDLGTIIRTEAPITTCIEKNDAGASRTLGPEPPVTAYIDQNDAGLSRTLRTEPSVTVYTEKSDTWASRTLSNLKDVCQSEKMDNLATLDNNTKTSSLSPGDVNKNNPNYNNKIPQHASSSILQRLSNNLGHIPSVTEGKTTPSLHTHASVSATGNNVTTLDQVPLPDINTKLGEKSVTHGKLNNTGVLEHGDTEEITVKDEYENQFLMINVSKNKVLVPLKIDENNPTMYVVNDQFGTIVEKCAKKVTVSFDPAKIAKAKKKSKSILSTPDNIIQKFIEGQKNAMSSAGQNVQQPIQHCQSVVPQEQQKQQQPPALLQSGKIVQQSGQQRQSVVLQQQQKQQQPPALLQSGQIVQQSGQQRQSVVLQQQQKQPPAQLQSGQNVQQSVQHRQSVVSQQQQKQPPPAQVRSGQNVQQSVQQRKSVVAQQQQKQPPAQLQSGQNKQQPVQQSNSAVQQQLSQLRSGQNQPVQQGQSIVPQQQQHSAPVLAQQLQQAPLTAQQTQQMFIPAAQGNQTFQLQQSVLPTVVRGQAAQQQNVLPVVVGGQRLIFQPNVGSQLSVAASVSVQAPVTGPAPSLSLPASMPAQARLSAPVKTVAGNIAEQLSTCQQAALLLQQQQLQNPVFYLPGANAVYVPPGSGQIVCDANGNKFLVPHSGATNAIVQAVQQLITPVQNQTAAVVTPVGNSNAQTQPNILRNSNNTATQAKAKYSNVNPEQLLATSALPTTQSPVTSVNQTWSQSQSSVTTSTYRCGSSVFPTPRPITEKQTNVKTPSEVVFSGKNVAMKPEPDVDDLSNQYSICSDGIDFIDQGNRAEPSTMSQYGQRNNQEFISPTQFAPLMTGSDRSTGDNPPKTNKRKSRPPVRKDFDELETEVDDGIDDSLDQDYSIFIVPDNPDEPPVPFEFQFNTISTTTEEKRVTIPDSLKSSCTGIL